MVEQELTATGGLKSMKTRSFIVGLVVLILSSSFGTFLVAGHGRDDRVRWVAENQLKIIQNQLAGLKGHLRAYKEKYDRYPSSDAGLANLDSFAASFKVELYRRRYAPPETLFIFCERWPAQFWLQSRSFVRAFRLDHGGQAPQNAEQLGWKPRGTDQQPPQPGEPARKRRGKRFRWVDMDVTIGRGNNVFLLSSAGVLSPWQAPYVYENRTGHDPAVFADSPANHDEKGRFSIRVDEGVYVSSVGGRVCAAELDAERRADTRYRLWGLGLLLVSVVCFILMIRGKAAITAGVAIVISAGMGIAIHRGGRAGTYVRTPLFCRRQPNAVMRHKKLLDAYRAAGVISDTTYGRNLSVLEPKETQ